MRIQLTSIHVDDPMEAFAFYTEVLGFVEQTYIPEARLAIVASPEDPEGTGLLLEPSGNSFAKEYRIGLYERELPAIVFGVEDIQEEFNRLNESGVYFMKEPTETEWGYEAIFDDTCGNMIQLAQVFDDELSNESS